MALTITNIGALHAYSQLGWLGRAINKSVERLSTGYRINSAADDPVGIGVSAKMEAQVRGLSQAEQNIEMGISLLQSTDSVLDEISDLLQDMRTAASAAASASATTAERIAYQSSINTYASEIERLSSSVIFNGDKILAGSSYVFQVGPNSGDSYGIQISPTNASILGIQVGKSYDAFGDVYISGPTVLTESDADFALTQIDSAIGLLTARWANVGAVENRLEHTLGAVQALGTQHSAALSSIRDADIAEEVMNLAKYQLLQSTATTLISNLYQNQASLVTTLLKAVA
ncbi:hypothetical protein KKH56_06005 [bacterium]|nr:hypothetical protein [bacterium]